MSVDSGSVYATQSQISSGFGFSLLSRGMFLDHGVSLPASSLVLSGLGESLPFRKNSIKQIFANDTLHHIKKQKESIEECYKIMRSKGKLIIREFDKRRFRVKLLILFEKIIRFGSKFFSPKELQELCHEVGFSTEFVPLTKSTYLIVGKKLS